jgi:hypothetical protein
MPFPIGTVPGSPFGFKGQNFITATPALATPALTQAAAFALGGYMNHVAVVATAGDAVKLPTAYESLPIIVFNASPNALTIFPWEGDAITLLTATTPQAANAPVTLASGLAMVLVCYVSQTKSGNYVGSGLWKQVV